MADTESPIVTLLHAAVLDAIDFLEISARRSLESDVPPEDPVPDGEGEMKLDFQVKDRLPDQDRSFRFALEVTFSNHEGRAVARPVATYHVGAEDALLLDDVDLMAEFGGKVAVMALIPFAREAIATVTSRVFLDPVLMPIFTTGQLHFSTIPPGDLGPVSGDGR
jgi:preprotein translocase subunit SecB